MTEPVSERTKQRRRILRAAAGAPIVLTLPSGAALAATSGMCDKNSLTKLAEEPTTTFKEGTEFAGDDSWMRVKLQKYLIRKDGASANDPRVPGFTFRESVQDIWYEVSDDLQSAVPIVPKNPDPTKEQGPNIQDGEFYYGLVSYDGEGGGFLLTHQTGKINPIAGASCWNSLTGADVTGKNVIMIN